MRWWYVVAVAVTLSAPGCGGDELTLFVELQTDLVPGREFDGVEVRVFAGRDDSGTPHIRTSPAFVTDDYRSPSRVAEIDGLAPGAHLVDVVLRNDAAETVVSRRIQVVLERTRALTVLITRDCRGVVCPGETCVGGVCVSQECGADDPAACGIAACATPSDCASPAPCAAASCVEGRCLYPATAEACGVDRWCDPDRGCVGGDDPTDAGRTDAGRDAGLDAGSTTDAEVDAGTGGTFLVGENAISTVTGTAHDTGLRESEPALNYGSSDVIEVEDSSTIKVGLFRFDLDALPAGVVQSAQLHVWTGTDSSSDGDLVEVFEVFEAWTAGTGDGTSGAASWILRQPGVPWTVPGAGPPGSRSRTRIATIAADSDDTEYIAPLPVSLVQRWLDDPAVNHGVVLSPTGSNAAQIQMSEESDATRRPYLRVVLE